MKNWLAGIAAAVIAGVIVYWLTTNSNGPAVSSQPDRPLHIAIVSPTSNTTVEMHDRLRGTVTDAGASIWIVVHPIETMDCWIQKPVIVDQDGSWVANVQFGEDKPKHSGSPYEVRALANPKQALKPGKTSCWPEAVATSRPLFVRRS